MKIKDLNICFNTSDIAACKEFYVKYFEAKITFDYSWYSSIMFEYGERKYFLSFMDPQNGEPLHHGGGVTLNLQVEDVDQEYKKIQETNVKIASPVQDKPWGDRSFCITDPLGNTLYIYSDREPSPEFKEAYKM